MYSQFFIYNTCSNLIFFSSLIPCMIIYSSFSFPFFYSCSSSFSYLTLSSFLDERSHFPPILLDLWLTLLSPDMLYLLSAFYWLLLLPFSTPICFVMRVSDRFVHLLLIEFKFFPGFCTVVVETRRPYHRL